MKEGWEYKKLGEVTTKISDGSHNPPHGIEYSEYPMLSSKNIFFDKYDYESPRYLSKEDFVIENKRTNISDGDVLLTIVGTVGRACCVKAPFTPFTLQRSVAVLKPKQEAIASRFLMYSLHSLSDLWEAEAKGVAQKGVYLKQVADVQIPIPSIEEQRQIVSELDLLSGVIEKQKAQLEELDKLAQSIFYDMFGDPENNPHNFDSKPLGEACLLKAGKAIKADELFVESEDLYPCFGGNGIRGYIDKYSHEGLFPIIGRQGALCGNVNLASGKFYATEHAVVVSPIIKMNTLWLYYELISMKLGQYAHGVAQPGLSVKDLNPLSIIIPPLSLQQEFAAKVETIEGMKEKVRQSLKEAETLFNSRMDYYFN